MNLLINRFIFILNIFFDDINRGVPLLYRDKAIASRPKIRLSAILI
nr:hypothetical protein [Borreliella burgdorferi]